MPTAMAAPPALLKETNPSFMRQKPPIDPNRKVDALFYFSVDHCNPNGDPDNGNRPRQDVETGQGLVSNVSIKRHVRDIVPILMANAPGFDIYVTRKAILDHKLQAIHEEMGVKKPKKKEKGADGVDEGPTGKEQREIEEKGAAIACKRFFDNRAFGAVMSSKEANCGQVRGPLQLSYSKTVDPVQIAEDSLVRLGLQTDREAKTNHMNQTFGNRFRVPFGLYCGQIYFTPAFARATKFSSQDFELFWECMARCFEYSRSSSRDGIAMEQIIAFEHDNSLGNAPTHRLFRAVTNFVKRKDASKPARDISDYAMPTKEEVEARITADGVNGVTVHYLL